MWRNMLNLFKRDDLFSQALHQSYEMLDMDWVMYEASVRSLRKSDTNEVAIDIFAQDKQINAYEREVRKKVMMHLSISGRGDLTSGLILVSVVIDIERIGDYAKNIYDLARNHPAILQAGALESNLQEVEAGVTKLFGDMITAFKQSDEELARTIMNNYKEILAQQCDEIIRSIISGSVTDLSPADAAAVCLYCRYLKRVAAHSRSVVSSIVNPFHRLGYKEKPAGY